MTNQVKSTSWMIVLPLAVAATAYFMLVFLPHRRAMAELHDQIALEQNFIAQSAGLNHALAMVRQDVETARKYCGTWQSRIPDERGLSTVFEKIHALAKEAGVRTTRFDPQLPVDYEQVRRVPVIIGCTGSFRQTFKFMAGLESLPALMWVEGVRIEHTALSRKDVLCEINLVVFANNSDISGYANLAR